MSQLQVTGEAKIRDIQGPVVANSGVITALDGAASQYVRGDGTLADFPTSTGGGSSVSYYLNSSVSQGTIGGVAYRELSKDPIIGAGTDINISANGYVANYITDANDPDVTIVPGGNFNCEFYFSVNNNTGNPTTYAELYKYDGTTFTLLGTSAGVPESINQGTTIAPYYFAIPVATAALSVTDRLAIRIYVSVDGRTVTLHTENGHLCQVVTTLSKGMVSLNNLTDQSQYLTTGTSGTDFNIVSSGDTHTFNLPVASATNTGKLSNTDWSTFNNKVPYTGATGSVDLGIYSLDASELFTNGNGIYIKKNLSGIANSVDYVALSSSTYKLNVAEASSATNAKIFNFDFSTLTDTTLSVNNTRTYTLPDSSGTLALTSNLSSYVPYTGATTNVDLGTRDLTSRFIYLNGIGTTGGNLFLRKDVDPAFTLNYTTLYSTDNNIGFGSTDGTNTKKAIFSFGSLTNNTERTFTLPDLSGTLALLEGTQTFSGSKTFSANPSINAGGQSSLSILSSTGNSALILGYVNNILKGTIDISATEFKLISAIDNILKFQSSNNFRASLIFSNSADYSYTFPAATGTIALTSNLSAYVPYTGATGNVDLGSNYIISSTIVFWKGTGSGLGNIGIGRIVPLGQNTTGQVNIGIGENSLFFNTTGSNNIALGGSANGNNTTGSGNIGIGSSANLSNTTGSNNIAIGINALRNNTVDYNVAIGHSTLYSNTTGVNNSALGSNSLRLNTTGGNNTAIGVNALQNNTTASFNTAIGNNSLNANTTGASNTAIGSESLISNTTGDSNVSIGATSLNSNTTGQSNVGVGVSSLGVNTTGQYNVAVGRSASNANTTGNYNTALGGQALANVTTGSQNIAIGYNSGGGITTGSQNTIIGTVTGLSSSLSNNIILADGAGNIRYQWNGTNNVFGNPISGTSATFKVNADRNLAIKYDTHITLSGQSDSGAPESLRVYADTFRLFTATTAAGLTERLTVTNGGNVGIGTSSPNSLLHLNSTATVKIEMSGGSAQNGILFNAVGSAPQYYIGAGNNLLVGGDRGILLGYNVANATAALFYNSISDAIIFGASPSTERMRITSDGKALFGTSTAGYGLFSTQRVTINPISDGIVVGPLPQNNSAYTTQAGDNTGTRYALYIANGSSSNVGSISFTSATTSYNITSDYRLKQDLKEFNGLSILSKVKTYDFEWKIDNSRMYGVIAHELQDVIPYAVLGEKDGEQMQSVDYSKLVPVLVKAIQEQTQIIKDLEARIVSLESK